MSRKIKVQTVNTDNLEKTLKENICTKTLESGISPALIEKTRKLMDKLREEDNPCNNDNTGDAIAYTNDFKKTKEIGKVLCEKDITSTKELTEKVLKSLDTKNKPGEFVISIPQDYETTMEEVNNMENNNTKCNKHYEEVNHPDHYNVYDVEVVEMMERIFGIEETMSWCKLNAFKYRMRAGEKPTSTVEKDLKKEKWCLNKYKELKSKN